MLTAPLPGDVAEQHPELFETLAIAGAMLIIPESWFLRPLFMVFGMSPEGPVEGACFSWPNTSVSLVSVYAHAHCSRSCTRAFTVRAGI